MNQYAKVYSKLFFRMLPYMLPVGIIAGIAAFILSPVLLLLTKENSDSPQLMTSIGLFACFGMIFFFSGIMSIALGSFHIMSVKASSFSEVEGAVNTRQQRNIKISMPYRGAFGLCLASLEAIGSHKILVSDRTKGEIKARSGLHWKTMGDTIEFQIGKIDQNQTNIIVTSKPMLPTTLVDYGKNLQNIEKIISFINEHQI